MAPAIGSGPVAWSALLAVALGALALGNLVGGELAGREAPGTAIAWPLIFASLALVLISQVYAPLMRWAAERTLFAAAVLAAMITQLAPMTLLGTLAPVILRTCKEEQRRSRWAGMVLAAGSVGGIVGALVAGLALLPGLGLSRSYVLISAFLAGTALPVALCECRYKTAGAAAAAILLAVVLVFMAAERGIIQSQHGQIEVRTIESGRLLLIDGMPQTGFSGDILPWEGLRHGYLLEVALLMRPRPQDALVIGLGGGLAPRLLEAHGVRCESVEIDPCVVRIAREEFGFKGAVSVADGRSFLQRSGERWDMIFLDVCTSDRLPLHLFTVEALHLLRGRLTPDGVLVIQFIGDDGPWSASLTRTVREVFDNACMLAPAMIGPSVGPRWILAGWFDLPLASEEFTGPDASVPWHLVHPTEEGDLLTDDHFPAELDWARTAALWRRSSSLGWFP